MTLRPSLAPFSLLLLASLAATACGSETSRERGEAGEEDEASEREEELNASCANPRRYFATLRDESEACTEIAAERGRWVPEPLFADMPPEAQASTCLYRWAGERYSRADRDAIVAQFAQNVFPTRGVLTPACGSSSRPDVGDLDPIPYIDTVGHAGSVGCDVCGIVKRGKVWVILPPEKIGLRQFQVQLSNGTSKAFQIRATDGARAIGLSLPPPPSGTQYKDGRISVY
jgi:hypothetical protein